MLDDAAERLTFSAICPPHRAYPVRPEGARLLGGTYFGAAVRDAEPNLPVQSILAPVLGDGVEAAGEAWFSSGDVGVGAFEGIRYRHTGNVLFGVVEAGEEDFAAPAGGATPLQRATESVYRRVFRVLDSVGMPHLWRVWNYFPRINVDEAGLERYRQFNIGRHEAFAASGRLQEGQLPAACALGVAEGPLAIAFLAGRTPAQGVENPRQTSAWRYPADYGPRSPTFARAGLVRLPGQELLFLAGTASIVGHRTVHPGDAAAQTVESLNNVAAVVGEANRLSRGQPFALEDLRYRVYVRHPGDFPCVRAGVEARLGAGTEVVYLQADICRADLLLEIEGTACRTLGNC